MEMEIHPDHQQEEVEKSDRDMGIEWQEHTYVYIQAVASSMI